MYTENINRKMAQTDSFMRRLLDVLAATIGLIMLSPLFIVIAVAIKAYDGGPIFYRARRVGKDGWIFSLYKFRTMVVDADRQGPAVTTSGDTRVTPIGRRLRHTKLDELPQLLNVFVGNMSLVGPRPEDPRYVSRYTGGQRQILSVRPGITSAASLAFRHEEQMLSGPEWETVYCTQVLPAKLGIDLEYLSKRTIRSDFGLILRTIAAMFK
jgi:lipopolysaccharide/colanic/teichoic acid biosynthesis glycosyltransferase